MGRGRRTGVGGGGLRAGAARGTGAAHLVGPVGAAVVPAPARGHVARRCLAGRPRRVVVRPHGPDAAGEPPPRPGPGGDPLVVTMPDTPGGAGNRGDPGPPAAPSRARCRTTPGCTSRGTASTRPRARCCCTIARTIRSAHRTCCGWTCRGLSWPTCPPASPRRRPYNCPTRPPTSGRPVAVAGFRDVIGTLWRVTDPVAVPPTRACQACGRRMCTSNLRHERYEVLPGAWFALKCAPAPSVVRTTCPEGRPCVTHCSARPVCA